MNFMRKNILLTLGLIFLSIHFIPIILLPSHFTPTDGMYTYEWGIVKFDVNSVHYDRKKKMAEVQWMATLEPSERLSDLCKFSFNDTFVMMENKRIDGRKSERENCDEEAIECLDGNKNMYFAWIGKNVPLDSKLVIQFTVSPECELDQEYININHKMNGIVKRSTIWEFVWNGLLSV